MKPDVSQPDPRLQRLDNLIGTWSLKHRDLETGEEWQGFDKFEWMDGGFFMAFHHEEFGRNIKGTMIIGYERGWGETEPSKELIGHWFESSSGNHFLYTWEIDDKNVVFWLGDRDSDLAFKGSFSEDLTTVTGIWKWPGGGYHLTMTKNEKS
jgi:hypothetical protein